MFPKIAGHAPDFANMSDEETEFDFTKKKKKKKPKDEAEEEAPAPAAEEEEEEDIDFTKKKKKKKPTDGAEEAPAAAAEDSDEDLDFGKKKKKEEKPKEKKEAKEDEAEGEDDDESDSGDEGGDTVGEMDEDGFVSIPAGREYKYEELLDRMYSLLVANNPELAGDRKRFLMKPPQVVREGSKRVVVINFGDICKTLNRSVDHVFAFMLAEMGTTGSIDASSRMVVKGRYPPKAIEQLIRRYVGEYVSCSSCKSPNTALQKSNRLYFMQCGNCGARRSVTPIKTGFVAISRGARRAKRNV